MKKFNITNRIHEIIEKFASIEDNNFVLLFPYKTIGKEFYKQLSEETKRKCSVIHISDFNFITKDKIIICVYFTSLSEDSFQRLYNSDNFIYFISDEIPKYGFLSYSIISETNPELLL